MNKLFKRMPTGGMRVFILIWLGQVVSLMGSGLTSFSLGIWVYQQTGSATKFALISLFTTLPGIVMLPIAGAIIARCNLRSCLILSDLGSGLSLLAIALPL